MLLSPGAIAGDTDYTPAPAPSGDKFLVYFYRMPAGNLSFRGAEIIVDGKKLFGLATGEYSYAYLPAGTHTVRADEGKLLWSSGGQSNEIALSGNAGETHYARVAVGTDISQFNPVSMFVLMEVKPLLGERQLAMSHLDPDTLAQLPPEFRE